MTPLMWACYNENETIVNHLLQLGADLNEKDINGKTAAHWYIYSVIIHVLYNTV